MIRVETVGMDGVTWAATAAFGPGLAATPDVPTITLSDVTADGKPVDASELPRDVEIDLYALAYTKGGN